VSEEELTNPTLLFFNRYKFDLIYSGLNVEFVLHFLLSLKEKKSKDHGKLWYWGDMQKCKDAIMWGALVRNEQLPTKFYEGFDRLLAGYKKEFAQARKKRMAEEISADPIPVNLYKHVLQWSLEENHVFVWFWTVAQWNFMARSASIDPLAFHNFTLGNDSIIGKYDDSKADNTMW